MPDALVDPLNGELEQAIREFRERVLPKLPPGVADTVARTTEDLVRSGIADRGLKEGAQAPDFTLRNAAGGPVQLSKLLASGPAVVTFYRGGW